MPHRMDVVVAAMKPTLISLSVTTKALGCPGMLSVSTNIWKGVFFCEQEVSTVGPKESLIPNRMLPFRLCCSIYRAQTGRVCFLSERCRMSESK